ncbi:unnamed protein product [Toxocara canis]|uniref:PH domain-containing protein n=1 Tax=Toxocara canis TaxID=6265 RepID=A0A183V7F6_TOXCA|nr:unnamed protein product [Toxocara canis]
MAEEFRGSNEFEAWVEAINYVAVEFLFPVSGTAVIRTTLSHVPLLPGKGADATANVLAATSVNALERDKCRCFGTQGSLPQTATASGNSNAEDDIVGRATESVEIRWDGCKE